MNKVELELDFAGWVNRAGEERKISEMSRVWDVLLFSLHSVPLLICSLNPWSEGQSSSEFLGSSEFGIWSSIWDWLEAKLDVL